jgi:uncharacterized protein (TIGR03663 family)
MSGDDATVGGSGSTSGGRPTPDRGERPDPRPDPEAARASSAPGPVLARDRTTAAVVAVVVAALLVRLLWLGARPFHWDEARVGYWTLRYVDTGAFAYRPVAGGPLPYVVGRWTLSLLPPTDAVARLPVALAGGVVPAAALLHRHRLGDAATVALAGLLAASPTLVYYSRALRGDLLVVALLLVAVAAATRFLDGGPRSLLYGAVAAGTLAVAASGFVVAHAVALLAAAALVYDHRRLLPADRDGDGDDDDGDGDRGLVPASARALRARVDSATAARAGLLAAGLHLLAFAPRAGSGPGPGLGRPTTWLAVLDEAFRRAPARFVGVRIAARSDGTGAHEFLPFVTGFAELALAAALPLLALAAYGAARDRYRPGGPSTAVALHVYWGGAALLVVPVATEVLGPWLLVHAVVPLAVPAAVGAVGLARVLGDAWDRSDPARVVAALLLVAAGAGHAGALYADDVYGAPDADDALAQFAQPADLDPLLANLTAATRDNDGVDVLYFGEALVAADGSDADSPPVPPEWGRRLPLPWYTERAGLETAGARDPAALDATEAPVVVTTPDRRGTVASRLEGRGYAADEYDLALVGRTVVVFVAE